tara:strand:+ start:149 stop:406 length:258 start_codon:yes stop_codon:yes gene_type:complete
MLDTRDNWLKVKTLSCDGKSDFALIILGQAKRCSSNWAVPGRSLAMRAPTAFRDEMLNGEIFYSLKVAMTLTEYWCRMQLWPASE